MGDLESRNLRTEKLRCCGQNWGVRKRTVLVILVFPILIFCGFLGSCHSRSESQTALDAGVPEQETPSEKLSGQVGHRAEDLHFVGRQTDLTLFKTPAGFDYSKVNIYIKGQRINLLENTAMDVMALLGERPKHASGKLFDSTYDGLKLWFAIDPVVVNEYLNSREPVTWSGDLYMIEITSPSYSVEGGGKVGDTFERIRRLYPDGIFNDVRQRQVDKNNRHYQYLVMGKGNEYGTGYDFGIDSSDIVVSITLLNASFAP